MGVLVHSIGAVEEKKASPKKMFFSVQIFRS